MRGVRGGSDSVAEWEGYEMSKASTDKTEKPRFARRLGRFRQDEDGGMIIFSLFLFVLILWFGGMAVDYMRFETTRAKLQATLDRAVLAAADLDQVLPPCDVVQDYFDKAGMADFLDQCNPQEGLNYRIVNATASADMPMLFADLPRVFTQPFSPGLSTLTVSSGSTAEERVSNVEVSLILDVSSSMQGSRFTNLVPAAHDFIDTVMANNGQGVDGLVTMSIFAYSAVVNPGDELASYYSLSDHHNYSNCMLIPDNLFNQTDLPFSPQSGAYTRVSHFDYGAQTATSVQPISRPWCFPGSENAAIIHTTDVGDLQGMVSDLVPFGNTAIDLGMKWGVALLDPASRSAVSGMVGSGTVPAIASGRPLDYDDPEGVLKVAVLMTDGANTTEYDLAEPYKSGMSTIWFWREYDNQPLWEVPKNRISIQYQGQNTPNNFDDDEFFYLDSPYYDRWADHPRGTNRDKYRNGTLNVSQTSMAGEGTHYENRAFHASWQDIYAGWVRTKIYNEFFNEPYSRGAIDYSTYVATYYSIEAIVGGGAANTRLSNVCQAARDEDIVIYAVAFEAPYGGQEALRDCASSPSHYFDVAGTDISGAFAAIASDIRALKLTQ